MVGVQAFLGTAALKWNGSLRENYTVKPAPRTHVQAIRKEQNRNSSRALPRRQPRSKSAVLGSHWK